MFVAVHVRLFRTALVQELRSAPGIEVVGSAGNGGSALARIGEMEPDVVVLDASSPGDLHEIRRFARLRCAPLVLAVGIADDPEEVVACAEAGAAAFVTSSQSTEELVAAVQSVARGELLCGPRVAGALFRRVGELARRRVRATARSELTPRELEIATLIRRGLSNREIATRLYIEPATVKNHVHNILAKLDAQSRDEVGARLGLGLERDADVGATVDLGRPV